MTWELGAVKGVKKWGIAQMRRKAFNFCLIMVLAAGLLRAADEFPKLSGPYLGQKPPGMTAEKFAQDFYWIDAKIIDELRPPAAKN
jgi:hypothetical protein